MNDISRSLPPLARLYLWATRRLYNELAWAYDLAACIVSLGRWDRWRRLALEYVERQPVLEVGFGTGELLMAMQHQGWQVTGIDLSPAMHRVTARKMGRRNGWAPRVLGPVQQLPFPNDCFGAIISTFPADYIVDFAALSEFARVLRSPDPATGQPDGRLIVVGLIVFIDHPIVQKVNRLIFGISVETPLHRYQHRSTVAGLEVDVIMREDPPFRLPIVVAEKIS